MSRTVEQIQLTPRMPKSLRVAAYDRVSGGKDAMLHSLTAQVDHYSTYIRHFHGWEYVGVYADEAKTGARAAGRISSVCSRTRTSLIWIFRLWKRN